MSFILPLTRNRSVAILARTVPNEKHWDELAPHLDAGGLTLHSSYEHAQYMDTNDRNAPWRHVMHALKHTYGQVQAHAFTIEGRREVGLFVPREHFLGQTALNTSSQNA